jgi:hypothetical protein
MALRLVVFHDGRLGLLRDGTIVDVSDLERAAARRVRIPCHDAQLRRLPSTGTLDGVGPLSPGDQVTMEVERVGRLSVRVELRKP